MFRLHPSELRLTRGGSGGVGHSLDGWSPASTRFVLQPTMPLHITKALKTTRVRNVAKMLDIAEEEKEVDVNKKRLLIKIK